MKITTIAIAVTLTSAQWFLAGPARAAGAGDGAPLGRGLMERLSDRPKQTFLPVEWKNADWTISPWGYVRLEYESVQNDERFSSSAPIGRNDGFILDNARVGIDATYRDQLTFLISLEGASDIQEDTNTPIGEIDVRLRDAYVRWDPCRYIGFQGGQFKAPFAAEELRSTSDLMFVSRAVGWEGVLVGRGFEEPSIALDRQLGVMLSPAAPLRFGDFGAAYYFMAGNGNGSNQLLNDNSDLAIIGRLEGLYSNFLTVGVGGFGNERSEGEDPANLARVDDTGVAADLLFNPGPAEIFFQFGQVDSDPQTTGAKVRVRRTWHVQAGYRIDTPWFFNVTPAYRFAQYDPWANADSGAANQDARELDYHTLGLRLAHTELPLSLFFNYTFTGEEEPNELHNDRLQVLAQVIF